MAQIEIVTIGDELTEGRLVDTNSAYLSNQLFEQGLRVDRHISVPDELDDIAGVLRDTASRAQAVLISGGLGPTTDDLTAEAAARAFGKALTLFPEALEHTRSIFARLGRTMSLNNEKQAWLPDGATVIPNHRGTAVGFCLDHGECRLYFFPGVPHELKGMFERWVLPDLLRRIPTKEQRIASFFTFGLGESKVGQMLEDLVVAPPGKLVIQYRAAFPEVHIRLCLRGYSALDLNADRELSRLSDEVLRRLSSAVYSTHQPSLPEAVLTLLIGVKQTLAVAESCTGGLLASLITAVPGASQAFLGGVVSYANSAKIDLLGVSPTSIDSVGAVSEEVAREMAVGARERFASGYALALTGVAGPAGGTPEKPVGTVYIALASASKTEVRRLNYPGDRERVQRLASYSALEMLRRSLVGQTLPDFLTR